MNLPLEWKCLLHCFPNLLYYFNVPVLCLDFALYICVNLFLDTLRNDLFLTLVRGEFEKGSKTAPKNVEVRITVIDKFGKELPVCIRNVLVTCI